MKCDNCPALTRTSYEYGEYECGARVLEDGKMATDGGCRYTLKVILRRMEHIADKEARQYEGIDVWYTESEMLGEAMVEAIAEAEKCSDTCVCNVLKTWPPYKETYSKANEELLREVTTRIRWEYEDRERKVQEQFCSECRWRTRPQKCACCRRNRRMRDLYEKEAEDGI